MRGGFYWLYDTLLDIWLTFGFSLLLFSKLKDLDFKTMWLEEPSRTMFSISIPNLLFMITDILNFNHNKLTNIIKKLYYNPISSFYLTKAYTARWKFVLCFYLLAQFPLFGFSVSIASKICFCLMFFVQSWMAPLRCSLNAQIPSYIFIFSFYSALQQIDCSRLILFFVWEFGAHFTA